MKRIATAVLILAAVTTAGCSRVRGQQGYVVDQTLVAAITPGVDNQASVEKTLGRPTFGGQFDQRDWYYVSRQTRQLAFSLPQPVTQTVLHVRFDERGNVISVDKTGVERVASISPVGDKTPTLGRNLSGSCIAHHQQCPQYFECHDWYYATHSGRR